MSLILDALNRSDREHENKDRVPDLHTIHGIPREPQQGKRNPYLILLIGVGVVVGALLVVILIFVLKDGPVVSEPSNTAAPRQESGDGASPAQEAALPSDTALDIPANVPASIENVESPAPPESPSDVSDEVLALYEADVDPEPVRIVEPEVAAAPTVIQPKDGGVESTVDKELARHLWEEARQEMTRPEPKHRPEPEPEPEAIEEVVDAPLEQTVAGFPEVPFLHELSTNFQNTIPTLMYAEHEYDAGTVTINKHVYTEGDEMAGGIQIERILADGVLLRFNGRDFKLSSLSSWVNY